MNARSARSERRRRHEQYPREDRHRNHEVDEPETLLANAGAGPIIHFHDRFSTHLAAFAPPPCAAAVPPRHATNGAPMRVRMFRFAAALVAAAGPCATAALTDAVMYR